MLVREMAEWLKAAVLKTVVALGYRGFESLSLCTAIKNADFTICIFYFKMFSVPYLLIN